MTPWPDRLASVVVDRQDKVVVPRQAHRAQDGPQLVRHREHPDGVLGWDPVVAAVDEQFAAAVDTHHVRVLDKKAGLGWIKML